MSARNPQRDSTEVPEPGTETVSDLPTADTIDSSVATESPPVASADHSSEPSGVNSPLEQNSALHRWSLLPPLTRRLSLWAAAVLMSAVLVRGATLVTPTLSTPQERFAAFARDVSFQLPKLLFGDDASDQDPMPYDVKAEVIPAGNAGPSPRGVLSFQEVASSSSGLTILTSYRADYEWRGDHWHCVNLNCSVQKPGLTELDRLNFESYLAQEEFEKAQSLINTKRQLAEDQLGANRPLGKLLRSGNQY